MKQAEQSSTSKEVPKVKSALLDKYKEEPKKEEALKAEEKPSEEPKKEEPKPEEKKE